MSFLKSKIFISLFLILTFSFLTGVFAVKAGLNTDYVKVEVIFDPDIIAPEITEFLIDGCDLNTTVYTDTSITIAWTVTDSGGSHLSQVEIWRAPDSGGIPGDWGEGPIATHSVPAGLDSWSNSDTNSPSDGIWWYGFHTVDTAGNCITANIETPNYGHCGGVSFDSLDPRTTLGPIKVVVVKDTINPCVDAFDITPSAPDWATSDITISWKVTDSGGSYLKHVEIWRAPDSGGIHGDWGSDPIVIYDAPDNTDEWISYVEHLKDNYLEDGIWWYGIHVVDKTDNKRTETESGLEPIKVQVDTLGPNSQIQSESPSGYWQKGNFTIDTLDEDPGGSGVDSDSCEYKVINYDSGGVEHKTLDWTYRACSDPALEITVGLGKNCRYESSEISPYSCYVYIRAYDLVGNKGESSKGYRIDWTEPIVGEISPLTATQGIEQTFTADLSDSGSVSGCWLYKDGSYQPQAYPVSILPTTISADYTFTNFGDYNMRFACRDAALNVGWGDEVIVSVAENFGNSAPIITDLSYFSSHSSTPDQECTNQFVCCMEPTTQTDCSVKFNISAYDPDGNPLTYTWDFDDGAPNSNEEDPSHHYTAADAYNVLVDVFDGTEHTQEILVVTVNNPAVSVGLTANPAWGTDSLSNVDLRAIVSGSMYGTINYKFDCANDDSYELEVDNQSSDDYTALNLCNYSIGNHMAKAFIQRGEGSAEDTANIDVVDSECTPGEQTDCTSSQGCSHTITCQGNSTWPFCPIDECTVNDTQSCGDGGTQTCTNSCVWDICAGEGECSPEPDSPACYCPIDGCVGSDYYDYPNFGDCTDSYSCSTGVETGQPCEPNIITNDPRCNESPVCDSLGASPEQGVAPLGVLFTGSAHDNDGTITNYGFIFGDGESGTTTNNTINHIYNNPGVYCAKLRIQDNDGTWTQIPGDCPSVCAKQINISENYPPLADIACNGSSCGIGSLCNGTWIAYNRNCQFYFLNQSTDANSTNPPDNNNDIIKSTWSIFYQGGTPWQDPYIICADNSETPENEGICDLLLPALPSSQNYYVTLTVEDRIGATDDYSKNFYVRREVAADFQCSLNPDESWQSCNGFVASEGEVVYFKDTSVFSEGSTGISNWSWTFEDGDPATSNNQNPSSSFVNITGSSGTVTVDITDNVGRTDTEQYQLQITIPLPQWEEVVPF